MTWLVLALYGWLAFVALTNFVFMRRPKPGDGPELCVLIPARDEAENLARLIPDLVEQGRALFPQSPSPGSGEGGFKVYVFDDESTDGTAEVAAQAGATVIRASEPLPEGWTGKNRACHELAKAAAEDSQADWWLFLDADVEPKPGFLSAMRHLAATDGRRVGMITGFPQILPGRGIEPLFLAWVGWILLASNPFGLVSISRKGHNRFKNGQVHLWKRSVYTDLWPNERVKGKIMEDVSIGRLLAKEKIAVETVNLSSVLAVRMYETWRETLDGMSKNSYEIMGSATGSIVLAAFFLLVGWAWLATGAWLVWTLGLLTLSGVAVAATARSAWWPVVLMPVVCTIGGITIIRSLIWKKTGQTRWKGRTYQ